MRTFLPSPVFTRLTAKESVSKLQSSFTIDLNQIGQALRNCTARSLLIIDECVASLRHDEAENGMLIGVLLAPQVRQGDDHVRRSWPPRRDDNASSQPRQGVPQDDRHDSLPGRATAFLTLGLRHTDAQDVRPCSELFSNALLPPDLPISFASMVSRRLVDRWVELLTTYTALCLPRRRSSLTKRRWTHRRQTAPSPICTA